MPSPNPGGGPINPVPLTPEQSCLNDVYAQIENLVSVVRADLTRDLNRPNLTLNIGGMPVQNNGVVAQGFENVTGLTQQHLLPQERETRLTALIDLQTRQALGALSRIVPGGNYDAYIRSFGVAIALSPGDAGFSPAQLKVQSEALLRSQLTAEVESLVRGKFNSLETHYLRMPPPPPEPAADPELLRTQKEILRVQQEQARLQREQAAKSTQETPKTPEQACAEKIRKAVENVLVPGQKLTTKEIYKWIEAGLELAKDRDRLVQKLKNTGLIDYTKRTTTDLDTGQETTSYKIYPGTTKSGYFQGLRSTSNLSWGATIGLSAIALMSAPAGAAGFAGALGILGAVNAVNLGVQSLLQLRFKTTFEATWKEIQTELGTMDPTRAPALSGLMYLLVDKYSPLYLFPNRTKVFRGKQPSSTEAVLDHLKEAAFAALNNVAGTTEGYYKGIDVKEKLTLTKTGLENLEKRWAWHWEKGTWLATGITTMSFMGALGFAAKAFG